MDSNPTSEAQHERWYLAAGLLVLVSLIFRVIALDRFPGLSGDEAQFFVTLRSYLHGQSSTLEFITPTQRPIPLWLATIYPLARGLDTSAWSLRIPGAFCGILLVACSAWTTRRLFTRLSVVLAITLAIACLPAHVAHSRMGWDAAQTTLATLFPAYFILKGNWKGTILAFMVGLVVHPLLVFLMPLALPVLFFEWVTKLSPSPRVHAMLRAALTGLGVISVFFLYNHFLSGRMAAPDTPNLFGFSRLFIDLLSGASSYEYFTSKPTGALATFLLIVGLATLALFAWSVWRTFTDASLPPRRRYFGAACAVGVLAFHLVSPHQNNGTERYLLIFTLPVIWTIGLALDRMPVMLGKRIAYGALAVSVMQLGLFAEFYFLRPIRGQPYTSNVYATGPQEPRAAAYAWISEQSKDGIKPTIVTDGFWNYWVSRFFSSVNAAQVKYIPNNDTPMPHVDRLATLQSFESAVQQQGYALGFSHGSLVRINNMLTKTVVCAQKDFTSFDGTPVVSVWKYCPRELSTR